MHEIVCRHVVGNLRKPQTKTQVCSLIGDCTCAFEDPQKNHKLPFLCVSQLTIPSRLCWGLTTHQPLWVILCRLPEKGRKVIEEIVEEIKERDREERNRNESEETEEIKIFPIYPYLLQG